MNSSALNNIDEREKAERSLNCMSPEQLAEAREYGHRKLQLRLIDMALDVGYLAVMTLVVAHPLDAWLVSIGFENAWLRLAAFFTLLSLIGSSVGFPVAWYAGYRLEHKYGLSRQSFGRWLRRLWLKSALSLAFGLLLVEGLFFLIHLTQGYWWLAAAGASFLVGVLLGQLVPVLIMPLFYKIERLDDEELLSRFDRLAEGTGLAIEGVYRMSLGRETAKANAMLAGLGRTRRVILSDTLLESFTQEEIEVVLAHEVGHHVHRHIAKFILFGLAMSTLTFFVCDRLLVTYASGVVPYDELPVHALPLLMLVITAFSLLLGPLNNGISRHFERQCDAYALQRTGNHAAYISAFEKLAQQNKADPTPPRLEVMLFHDHPPISQRLAMAADLDFTPPRD